MSVTVLSDDSPFDASALVGPGGSADLDAVHALDDQDQVPFKSNKIASTSPGACNCTHTTPLNPRHQTPKPLPQPYDEDEPGAYLLCKDLIAMSKTRPGEDVEITVLSDTTAQGLAPPCSSCRPGVVDALGWGGGGVEYSEDEPEAYLLCKDLENLVMRGVEQVEITVIRDDEVPKPL